MQILFYVFIFLFGICLITVFFIIYKKIKRFINHKIRNEKSVWKRENSFIIFRFLTNHENWVLITIIILGLIFVICSGFISGEIYNIAYISFLK